MKQLLKQIGACKDAVLWAGDKTWEEIFNTCHRGDWLLWLYKRTNQNNLKKFILAKAHCANTVRHLMKDKRSINAIDTAIKFGNEECTKLELNAYATAYAAADAADADAAAATAYAAADAAAATAYAAAAYAAAADADATDAYAAAAAAYAAYAATAYAAAAAAYAAYAATAYAAAYAAAAAADADATDAKIKNQQLTADICRKYLPIKIWNFKNL